VGVSHREKRLLLTVLAMMQERVRQLAPDAEFTTPT
jgi:hypothetical protein